MSVTEKIEQVVTSPVVSKIAPVIPVGSGSAYILDLTQGILALISIVLGVIAGIYVAKINYKRNKLMDIELEIKKLERKKARDEVKGGD